MAQGSLSEGRGRGSFGGSKGSVVAADLELLLWMTPLQGLQGQLLLEFLLGEILGTVDTSPTLSFCRSGG